MNALNGPPGRPLPRGRVGGASRRSFEPPALLPSFACCAALASLRLAGGGDGSTTPAGARAGLQVTVTIPPGPEASTGAALTVRVQDSETRDDVAPAVTQTVAASLVVSLRVPGVPEGAKVVVRAVLASEAAEVLSGETAVESVSWNVPVAVTL